ncbi:MAG TPA: hypothetical protein DEB39_03850 [Planctomycetaceae bacterium]|nr:hypothetical protein [Planctomycetaceae bacterium]
MSDPTLPVDDVRLDASIPVAEDVDHYDPVLENIRSQTPIKDLIRSVPGVFVSIAVHLLIILVLGAVYLPQVIDFQQQIESGMEELEEVEDLDELFEQDEVKEIDLSEMNDVTDFTEDIVSDTPDVDFSEAPPQLEVATVTVGDPTMFESLISKPGAKTGDLDGRKNRGDNVARYGGNEHSERAVAAALAWLAAHQLPDGSWCYNHAIAPDCRGQCRNPSDRPDIIAARNSATAMAVLPFLGAGITPKAGEKYRPVVRDGINFLKNNAIRSKEGIRFYEQNVNSYQMYHQGICSITVCEAAAMTRDKELEDLAQGAIRFICYAQHEQGGWRYAPKQAGDTSAFGWVFMALKSGQMAYLQVPPVTVKKAKSFLDTVVGYEGGARYGYDRNNGGSAAVTAIGLLSQMYMGWKADNSSLQKGADFLSATGPRANDLYYCYYATQVLHHLGGERWEKWNRAMRDALVKSQATEGHEKGSWVDGGHATVGGRIVGTSFGAMILEVYYRHLPIYTKSTTASEFPLD